MLTANDIYMNIISRYCPDKIITSSDFKISDFLAKLAGVDEITECTFYLSNTGNFVTFDEPVLSVAENYSLQAREVCSNYTQQTPPLLTRTRLFGGI